MLKIAVTSTGPTLEDRVDARFGRCACFLVVDLDSMAFEAIENPNVAAGGGAGIQSAQLMAEKGVQAILTGNCGPNAFQVFGAAGIQVVVGVSGIVRDAIEQYRQGAFSTAAEANVVSHFGMGAGGSNLDIGMGGVGMGRGMGNGGGRGMGMGGGRGMGGGGGRGMGGGGRGMGMGGGMGGQAPLGFGPSASTGMMEGELASLRAEAQQAEERLREVNARIGELESGISLSPLVAVVDIGRCVLCATCRAVCPVDAISVGESLRIEAGLCTGCGRCVAACPQRALTLQRR